MSKQPRMFNERRRFNLEPNWDKMARREARHEARRQQRSPQQRTADAVPGVIIVVVMVAASLLGFIHHNHG